MTAADHRKQGRVRLDPDERREQILNAALEDFHTKGYAQTSVRDLAEASGLSIAGMYHYFESKEDILFAIIEGAVCRLVTELEEAQRAAGTNVERVPAMLAATIRVIVENRAEIRIQIDNVDKLPPERKGMVRSKQAESARLLRSVFEGLKAEGSLRDLDLNVLTFALNGMANWIYFWYDPQGPIAVDELAEQMAELFLHGALK